MRGWLAVGGKRIFIRSRWEGRYAVFLEFQKSKGMIVEWEYEPETFWFKQIQRGCRSYLPDFRVTLPGNWIEFHEVKGWMDPRSKTKLKRMAKYYPDTILKIVSTKWFKKNEVAWRLALKSIPKKFERTK